VPSFVRPFVGRTLHKFGGVLGAQVKDSDSRLVEHMLASVAQHQREKNAEQTSNRMKGRMMNGYSVFAAPVGYVYKKTGSHGKLLTRDEPIASIIQEGLEGYASGRFASQAELKRFFEAQPAYPKDLPGGLIRQQRISDMIGRVLYAGYIEHEPWGISRRKGHHEPIITFETFTKIQKRKAKKALAPMRKDLNLDFPLRGNINCACCDEPMTSCWSKSANGKRYPYYWCQTRDCSEYRKSIRAEKIDTAFETIMEKLTPTKSLVDVVKAMIKSAWDQRMDQAKFAKSTYKREIAQLDKQQDALLERLVETSTPKTIAAFETKIAKLEDEKQVLIEKMGKNTKPKFAMEEIFELLVMFLANPWKIYDKGSLPVKKTVLKTVFRSPLAYDRKTGFRTPQTTVIYGFLDEISKKCKMVRPARLELARVLPHSDLNAARLPIPPRPHALAHYEISSVDQSRFQEGK
jgi:site-specific DNA recombinase